MTEATDKTESASWDNYWRGARNAAAFSSGGISHPALTRFWQQFFTQIGKASSADRAIDIASGNGAVIESAMSFFGDDGPRFSCLDVSQAAVDAIMQRFPSVEGIVADARSTELAPGSFSMATSQFGVEYAGREAVFEMARLVRPGGWLGLVMHCRHGGIFAECSASLDAVGRLRASEFLPRAIALFRAGFAACQGADRAPYEAAARRFAPAIEQLETIMLEHGPHVAGDTLLRLHENVDRFHQDMPSYRPEEVLHWLSRNEDELSAYAERMQSMCDAALDEPAFTHIVDQLKNRDFTIEKAEALELDPALPPLAWVLIANRAPLPPA